MAASEYSATVEAKTWVTSTVFQLRFKPDQPVSFSAGQWLSVVAPGKGANGKDLRRAYSIASFPEDTSLELCIKLVEGGPGTSYLNSLAPGDRIRFFAPYGAFTYKPKPGFGICFLATGTGVSPFRSMLLSQEFQKNPPADILFLFGARDESEVLYQDVLTQRHRVKWESCLTRPSANWKGFRGRITDYLRGLNDSFPWTKTDFYLCGNGAMIDEAKLILKERGVDKSSIHQEIYYKTAKPEA